MVTRSPGPETPASGAGAGLCDGAEGLFDDVGEAALFVAGGGVGAAVDEALAEVVVVPGHLADEVAGYLFRLLRGR